MHAEISQFQKNCVLIGSETEKILFVSGLSAYNIISRKGYLVHDVYRPKKFNVDNLMQLRSHLKWILQYISYYRKGMTVAKELIQKNRNGLIVSDEDFASIAVGDKMKRKRILITDLLGTPFVKGSWLSSVIESKMNKSMQLMTKKCNDVIIPDYGQDKDNVSYVGPIVRNLSTIDRMGLRKKFGMDKKTILVTIGGTDAGKYLIEMAIKAYEKLKGRLDIDMMIASGPSLRIKNNGKSYSRNIGFVDNLHEYIYASDLLVSLAGRSTINESVAYSTPGIFVPIKNHLEQEENARRLGYRYEDIFRLESLVEEKISTISDSRHNLNACNTGSQKAAQIILKLVN